MKEEIIKMTYKNQFGKYEIKMGGLVYKWFKDLKNAEAHFERLAKAPDELEDDITLVEIRTGKVLRVCKSEME